MYRAIDQLGPVIDVLAAERGDLAPAGSPALWPSEWAHRVALTQINARFAAYRDALGLDPALGRHSLRRSYVTT